MAIRALKWGAENQSLQDQVSLFFLSHCFPKIKRRFTFVDRAYFHDNSLAEWKYQDGDEPFADSKIHIGHPELQQLLRNLQIPQDVKNRFDFTEELSTKWFQAILTLFKVYRTGFDDVRPNISSILCASTMSSLLLRKIPEIFWRLESLNQALGNSRLNAEQRWYTENKRDIPDSPIEMSVDPIDNLQFVQGHGPADTSSEQDSTLSPEDEDEIKEWESLLLNSELVEKLEKQSIPYQSQLFVASIESVNSWTRAVASICRRRYLCQARIHLDVKIFEIPGMPLRDPTPSEVEALRRRWTQQLTVGQLSNFQTILATTRGSKTPRPGCHSEAVIMAVFLCKEAADELDKLPPKVREAFRDIIELNQHYNYGEQDYIPIGVSTPICATCRLFERSLFWNAHMTFGCASRTGKCAPWIPPSWTPKQNLIELESALLEKLMDKLPHTSW
ncbi:hypothetical protein E1B28_012486 [Marasmius oreades]|uniref:Uncharacterized protein n=1 Tax=Marasmius oreades TaxID=181124 RepID=A0A9P7RSY5_9AGAR|nr:uncharacterized protein E1B28_012486 [Marasmius oreades]KAG7088498.1 hypothetical protein E1B28_012486 [Marasmius oreades]